MQKFQPDRREWEFLRRRMAELGLSPNDPDALNLVINQTICMVGHAQNLGIFVPMKYLLLDSNHQPQECTSEEWSEWMKTTPNLGVEFTEVHGCAVGTKFLSILPHDDAPCWRTEVIGGALHGKIEVCSGNREYAEAMHADMVKRIENLKSPPRRKFDE